MNIFTVLKYLPSQVNNSKMTDETRSFAKIDMMSRAPMKIKCHKAKPYLLCKKEQQKFATKATQTENLKVSTSDIIILE